MAQYTGFVKSYNEAKGWGFIECPQTQAVYGKDIFVLRSALSGGGQGDQVMFNVVDHGRGPQASDVVVLGSARPATPLGAVNGPMNGHGYTQQMQPMPTARSAPMTLYSQPVNQHAGSSMVGTVKSYNAEKGWGFVTSPEVVEMYGKDVFFMKSSVVGGVIERNQQVSFTVVSGTKGMQAEKVCPLSPAAMPAMPRDSAFPATRAPPPLMIPVVPQMPRMLAPPAAARPAPDQLFFGAVKGYNEEKGWGHISCEAAKAVYGKEVFLHRGALGGAVVEPGTLLAFQVMMAPKGPQACEVSVLPAETFQFEGQPGRQFLGTVKMFNAEKRWGFVTSDEITALFSGKDIFLHQNALQDASLPQVGQEVRFSIEVGESGKLQAKEVILEGVGLSATEDAGFSPVRPGVPSERAAPY